MSDEIWVKINIDGVLYTYYEISNKGRVRSLDRVLCNINGVCNNIKGKILSPGIRGISGNDYYFIRLSENFMKKYQIHQLVYYSFNTNSKKDKNMVVDHKDNDKSAKALVYKNE